MRGVLVECFTCLSCAEKVFDTVVSADDADELGWEVENAQWSCVTQG